jgi:hypothetical protein
MHCTFAEIATLFFSIDIESCRNGSKNQSLLFPGLIQPTCGTSQNWLFFLDTFILGLFRYGRAHFTEQTLTDSQSELMENSRHVQVATLRWPANRKYNTRHEGKIEVFICFPSIFVKRFLSHLGCFS